MTTPDPAMPAVPAMPAAAAPPVAPAAPVATGGRHGDGRFERLALDILRRRSRARVALRPWLVATWPWSWVARRPLPRSAALAAAAAGLASAAAAAGGGWSGLLAAKVVLAAAQLFLGLVMPFAVAAVYGRLYARLRHIALMPDETFTRWYLAKASAVLGHVNLHGTGGAADADPRGPRRVPREDRFHWAVTSVQVVFGASLYCYYFNRAAARDAGWVACGALLCAAAAAVAWFTTQSLLTVRFALDLARLPVRYYPDIPASVSLKVVGDAYLVLAFAYSLLYVPTIALGYVSRVPVDAATVALAAFGGTFLFASVVVSQAALAVVFHGHRERRLVEYGLHVEEAFRRFMADPSAAAHARLAELLRQTDVLRRLPRTGFTPWSAAAFAALVLFDVGLVVAYFALSARGLWLTG